MNADEAYDLTYEHMCNARNAAYSNPHWPSPADLQRGPLKALEDINFAAIIDRVVDTTAQEGGPSLQRLSDIPQDILRLLLRKAANDAPYFMSWQAEYYKAEFAGLPPVKRFKMFLCAMFAAKIVEYVHVCKDKLTGDTTVHDFPMLLRVYVGLFKDAWLAASLDGIKL